MTSAVFNATIHDFTEARSRMNATKPATSRFQQVMDRLFSAVEWLEANGLTILSLRQPLAGTPWVLVSARPAVYALFSGRNERKGYLQDGALRYEVWEAMDRENDVIVRWMEVIACH